MRVATEADLPAIVAIYNTTVPTRQSTADTAEVSVASRMEWFRQHAPGRRPLLVHEHEGKVVAWVSFQSFYGRPAYDHTAEVSIYLAPEHRGHGLGRKLLAEALGLTQELRIKTVLGFVFSHNEPSIRLFKSFGFEDWGTLPNVAEMDGKEYSLLILGKRPNPQMRPVEGVRRPDRPKRPDRLDRVAGTRFDRVASVDDVDQVDRPCLRRRGTRPA